MKRLTLLILGALAIWFAGRESGKQAATVLEKPSTTARSSSSTADIEHAYHGVDLGVPTDHSAREPTEPAEDEVAIEEILPIEPKDASPKSAAETPQLAEKENTDAMDATSIDDSVASMTAATMEKAEDAANAIEGGMKAADETTAAVEDEKPSTESQNQLASAITSKKQAEILAAIGLTVEDVVADDDVAETNDSDKQSTAAESSLATKTEESAANEALPVSRHLQDLRNRLKREASENK